MDIRTAGGKMRDLRIGEELFVEFGQVRLLYDIHYF